jgi:hypothetical protein
MGFLHPSGARAVALALILLAGLAAPASPEGGQRRRAAIPSFARAGLVQDTSERSP